MNISIDPLIRKDYFIKAEDKEVELVGAVRYDKVPFHTAVLTLSDNLKNDFNAYIYTDSPDNSELTLFVDPREDDSDDLRLEKHSGAGTKDFRVVLEVAAINRFKEKGGLEIGEISVEGEVTLRFKGDPSEYVVTAPIRIEKFEYNTDVKSYAHPWVIDFGGSTSVILSSIDDSIRAFPDFPKDSILYVFTNRDRPNQVDHDLVIDRDRLSPENFIGVVNHLKPNFHQKQGPALLSQKGWRELSQTYMSAIIRRAAHSARSLPDRLIATVPAGWSPTLVASFREILVGAMAENRKELKAEDIIIMDEASAGGIAVLNDMVEKYTPAAASYLLSEKSDGRISLYATLDIGASTTDISVATLSVNKQSDNGSYGFYASSKLEGITGLNFGGDAMTRLITLMLLARLALNWNREVDGLEDSEKKDLEKLRDGDIEEFGDPLFLGTNAKTRNILEKFNMFFPPNIKSMDEEARQQIGIQYMMECEKFLKHCRESLQLIAEQLKLLLNTPNEAGAYPESVNYQDVEEIIMQTGLLGTLRAMSANPPIVIFNELLLGKEKLELLDNVSFDRAPLDEYLHSHYKDGDLDWIQYGFETHQLKLLAPAIREIMKALAGLAGSCAKSIRPESAIPLSKILLTGKGSGLRELQAETPGEHSAYAHHVEEKWLYLHHPQRIMSIAERKLAVSKGAFTAQYSRDNQTGWRWELENFQDCLPWNLARRKVDNTYEILVPRRTPIMNGEKNEYRYEFTDTAPREAHLYRIDYEGGPATELGTLPLPKEGDQKVAIIIDKDRQIRNHQGEYIKPARHILSTKSAVTLADDYSQRW